MKRTVTLILLIAILFLSIPVYANDGYLGRFGETVYPMGSTDVTMVSEDIHIVSDGNVTADISCEFVFYNSGEDQTVLMGFPASHEFKDDGLGSAENLRLHNFTAYRNGEEINVSEVEGSSLGSEYDTFESWFVFEVPFKAGETLTMTHTYDIGLSVSGDTRMIGYILKTGATWAGPIGHARVTIDMSLFNAYGIFGIYNDFDSKDRTERYFTPISDLKYENGNIVFEKSDFEPTQNIEVWMTFKGLKDWWGIELFRDDVEWESVKFFDNAATMENDDLIKTYNDLSYTDKLFETIYLNTVLGLPDESYPPVVTESYDGDYWDIVAVVEDSNYDTYSYCDITYKDKNGNIVHTYKLLNHQNFGGFRDYGELLFVGNKPSNLPIEGYTYEITAYDYAGNTSTTVFDQDGNIIKQTVNGMIVIENIPNPRTNESPVYMVWALVLSGVGAVLLIFNKKRPAYIGEYSTIDSFDYHSLP